MIQIYSPSNTDYEHNGDCVLWPSRCELSAEMNSAWSLQLEHPIDDDGRWNYIVENAVLKVPTWMSTKYQRYRIRVVEKTETMITATAYPVFFDSRDDAYIFDIRVTNKSASAALNLLKAAAPSKYSVSTNLATVESEVFQNCNLLEALTGKFRDRWGGEILYNNNQFIINQRIGGDYGVTVEYGKNITGITYNIDMTDVSTRLIPYAYIGRMISGNTPWVDSPIINSYPKAFIRTVQFENVKLAEDATDDDATDQSITICATQADLDTELRRLCNKMYTDGADKPKISMSIDMLALEDTDEYAEFSQLEEIGLGDTVHCKHSKLGIISDARVVGIVWDCARDRIASVTLGDFAYDFLRNTPIDDIMSSIDEMARNLNPDGSLMAERIKGLLNGMNTQLNAQYTAAKKQDVMAILFENLDPQSPLYGALGIGTQGLQISKTRTADGKGWEWTTAATANGVVADTVVTGTLSDKIGRNYWDLDNGDMSIVASSFRLIAGGSQKTIQQLIEEGTSDNLLIDPIGLSTDYWTIHGTLVTGQSDPLGGTNAVKLTPVSGDEGYIQARKDTNTPFDTMGSRYKLTVWLKSSINASLFDNNPIKLYLNRVGSEDIFPTTTWQQYSIEVDVASIAIGDIVTIGGFGSFASSDGYDLYIYEPRVEKVLTNEEVFNKVSNYGETQGIWVAENGKLYINMEYLRSGIAKFGGLGNTNGEIYVLDANGTTIAKVDKDGYWFTPTGDFTTNYIKLTGGGLEGFQTISGQNRGAGNYGFDFSGSKPAAVIDFSGNFRVMAMSSGIYVIDASSSGITFNVPLLGYVGFAGYVFIQGRNPTTGYGLDVQEAANFQGGIMTTNIWYTGSLIPTSNSDIRLKENIKPTDSDIIDLLNVVQFDWKKDGKHVSAGLIAQEVEKILPELVNHESKEGYLGLDYVGFVPHLIKKVQEQQKQIRGLEARLSALENLLGNK